MTTTPIKKIVLAYSGGLDTSVIVPWLKENYPGAEVVCFVANIGQNDDLTGIEGKVLRPMALPVIMALAGSLFLAVTPVSRDQGQTIFANGTLAYEALSSEMKRKVGQLEGLHAQPGSGRSRDKALAGIAPRAFAAHERSQRQPLVRIHPVTGKPALYLCESGQMDWFEGPIVGMQPGPHGDGAALVDELMAHYTRPEFIYVHEWNQGDLIVWDNRCLVHTATWFDAEKQNRVMWRTTVHGNPGPLYAGEKKSWIPELADASTE